MEQYRGLRNTPTEIEFNWSLPRQSSEISFSTNDSRNIVYPYAREKVNTDPDFTYFTKINSKLIIDEWLWGNQSKWEVGETEGIYIAKQLFSMVLYSKYATLFISQNP